MTTSTITVPTTRAEDGNWTFKKHDQMNAVVATIGTVGWPAGSFNVQPVIDTPTNTVHGSIAYTAPGPLLTMTNVPMGNTTSAFPRPGAQVSIKLGAALVGEYVIVSDTPQAGQMRFINLGLQLHKLDAAAVDHGVAFAAADGTVNDFTWTLVSLP